MKLGNFTIEKIGGSKSGQAGLSAAAIYNVGKAPATGFQPKGLGVLKIWPPGYLHDPAFLASMRESAPHN